MITSALHATLLPFCAVRRLVVRIIQAGKLHVVGFLLVGRVGDQDASSIGTVDCEDFPFKLRGARLYSPRRCQTQRSCTTIHAERDHGFTQCLVRTRYSRNRSLLLEVGFSNGSHTPFNHILESFIANRTAHTISQLQGPRSVLRNSLVPRHMAKTFIHRLEANVATNQGCLSPSPVVVVIACLEMVPCGACPLHRGILRLKLYVRLRVSCKIDLRYILCFPSFLSCQSPWIFFLGWLSESFSATSLPFVLQISNFFSKPI